MFGCQLFQLIIVPSLIELNNDLLNSSELLT